MERGDNVRGNMHAIDEYSKQIADERQAGGRITTEADDKVEIDNYKKLFCLYY